VNTSALTQSRQYLAEHRRLIVGRSIAASVAGSLPIPLLDDWLSSAIIRGTMRRIADARGVDIDDQAIQAIAHGPESPPAWKDILGGGLALKLLARQWRKLVFAVLAARRARAAARAFTVATLFDHYCARLHVGYGIDEAQALEIRRLIDESMEDTPGGLSRHMFRRGLVLAARASIRGPARAFNTLTGGLISRLLRSGDEVEAAEEVEAVLDGELSSDQSFLSRSVTAIELQLASDKNPYLDDLLDHFDQVWRTSESEDAD